MEELKTVLENLNSALYELRDKVSKVDGQLKDLNIQKIRQDEIEITLAQMSKDLDAREGEIKNIESIVEYSAQAKTMMKEAKAQIENANIRQAELEAGFKKLAKDKAEAEKKNADEDQINKKQADALRKERKEFDEQVKEFKIRKKVDAELSK